MEATRKFLKQQTGLGVWIAYGVTEVEGYVLTVSKRAAEIQRKDNGDVVTVALAAIEEMVEA